MSWLIGLVLLLAGIGLSPAVLDKSTDVPTKGEWLVFLMMLGGATILTIEVCLTLFDGLQYLTQRRAM